jgi:chitin disaccharide deacetylase
MLKHNLRDSRLVLHADDLGMNRAISDGIRRGFRQGLLTGTSLLANGPDAGRALEQWKTLAAEHAAGRLPSAAARAVLDDPPQPFDLGVHLNLTQGRPLTGSRYPAELLDPFGRFPGVFTLFARLRRCGGKFHAAIQTELGQQVQFVCDHGLQPTHLNGHQYIELIPAVAEVLIEMLPRFGVKAVRVARERGLWRSTALSRRFWRWPMACVKRAFAARFRARIDALGVTHPDVFFGTAHAGDVDLRLLQRFLTSAGKDQLIEIGLHPGEPAEDRSPEERAVDWRDPLAGRRPDELRMLLSAELPALLKSAGWNLGRL